MNKSLIKFLWVAWVALSTFTVGMGQENKASEVTTDTAVYQGRAAAIDLPMDLHVQNIPAPVDRQGLCVFASLQMAANWGGTEALYDLIHKVKFGGGWPAKVDHYLQLLAPKLPYVQYEGKDPAILDLAIRMGRPVCITYGYGEFYRNRTIAHMVFLAHIDDEVAAIIDNNDPKHWTWMSRNELLRRAMHPSGEFWAVVLLDPPPPLVPSN